RTKRPAGRQASLSCLTLRLVGPRTARTQRATMGSMSDEPISVPARERTEAQKAEDEKDYARIELMKELLAQLKPVLSATLQQALSLAHEPTKEQLQALADKIDHVAQAGR